MFGLGWPEIVLVLVIALIVLGPKKLPEVAKGLGKALAEFRRTSQEVRDSIELEVQRSDEAARLEAARAKAREREARLAAEAAAAPGAVSPDSKGGPMAAVTPTPPIPASSVEQAKKETGSDES